MLIKKCCRGRRRFSFSLAGSHHSQNAHILSSDAYYQFAMYRRLENYACADQPTRAKELGTKPEEQAVGGAKIGRSAAGPLQDQELLLQEDTLRENGSGSCNSKEDSQCSQQMHQQYNRIFHGQAACAALESGPRKPDRRRGAPQLRIRHVQGKKALRPAF
jgi:hypothetical protein